MKKLLFLFVLFFSGLGYSQHSNTYKFIENKGQWNEKVKFKTELQGGALYLESNKLTYSFYDEKALESYFHAHHSHAPKQELTRFKLHAYQVEFVGGNVSKIERENQTKEYYNYFLGSDRSKWANNVYGYGTINYNELLVSKSFREVFKETFIPLLNEIGLLWQTDTISPAHEHFITGLIKQKILINTEKLQHLKPTKKDKVFVTYLPENEIHEIGLLYLNYEIVLRGYQCIYLGQTIPMENLMDVMKYFDNIHFLSYFTVVPEKDKINAYVEDFQSLVSEYNNPNLWILGRQVQHIDDNKLPSFIKTFTSIDQVVSQL